MRNENGITLVALVSTIIIIMILAGVTTYSGLESYKDMKKENFIAQMKVIQEKVDLINTEYKNWDGYNIAESNNFSNYLGSLGFTLASSTEISSWVDDTDLSKYYYFITSDIKDKLGLDGFEDTEFILAINFENKKVFEKKGVSYNDEIYHSQYDLPGGQKIITQNTVTSSVYTKNKTIKYYGLNAEIKLNWTCKKNEQTIAVTNYEYREETEEANIWHKVTETDGTNYIININKSGNYKIRADSNDTVIDENIVITLVNPPVLTQGMKPVIYSDSESTWTDVGANSGDWYDYSPNVKKWANAKTADGSMWVWIPRYAYKISGSTIDIGFLKNTSNTFTNGKTDSTYTVMPAFQDGTSTNFENGEWDSEITGIWVAKFDATGTKNVAEGTKGVTSLPATQAIYNIKPSDAFISCRKMETCSDYGWNTASNLNLSNSNYGKFTNDNNEFDTHLIKNSEWGAVTYLTWSAYGKMNNSLDNQVSKNSSTSYYTGGQNNATNVFSSSTSLQMSSTGNCYGIYDLVGAANTIVASGINIAGIYNAVDNNISTKYATVYKANSSENLNKGDGIKEMLDDIWGTHLKTYPDATKMIFKRGGNHNATYTHIFNFESLENAEVEGNGFRPVLIVK